MVGVEDVEGPVLLEGVVVGGVEEVEVLLEELADDLGPLVHAGDPLVDGEGGAVEVPLQVQLVLLLLLVVKVTVYGQLFPP